MENSLNYSNSDSESNYNNNLPNNNIPDNNINNISVSNNKSKVINKNNSKKVIKKNNLSEKKKNKEAIKKDLGITLFGKIKKKEGKKALIEKTESINQQLYEDFKDLKIFRAVIEFPGSYTRDNKNVDSLQKLLFSIGILVNLFILRLKCSVEFVSVAEWKGNSPKSYTEQYIRQYLKLDNNITISDHISDACGIGLYYLKKMRLAA